VNLWHFIAILIILGVVSGHITHIMVTGIIFEGLRRRIKVLGESRGGICAYFSEGFHCQLCCGVWYSSIIALLWTTGLYILRPSLWDGIAERPLGWITPFAWVSLFIVQAFFIAAVGHLFREIVGLIEDQRMKAEEDVEILEQTKRRFGTQ